MSIFSERLREVMNAKGFTQVRLAEMLRENGVAITRQCISTYMNGTSSPTAERITQICKALDVSADWMLGLSTAYDKTPWEVERRQILDILLMEASDGTD